MITMTTTIYNFHLLSRVDRMIDLLQSKGASEELAEATILTLFKIEQQENFYLLKKMLETLCIVYEMDGNLISIHLNNTSYN